MNKEKGFKLNDQQKIAFGESALKKLSELYPQHLTNMTIDEIGATSLIFTDQSADNTLVLSFEDYDIVGHLLFIGYRYPSGNCSDVIRPLYLDYMCQTFGDPYRAKAMAHWQAQSATEYSEYQTNRAAAFAKLTAEFDRKEENILDKRNTIFNALGQTNTQESNLPAEQKLRQFVALPMTPKTNATTATAPDHEK